MALIQKSKLKSCYTNDKIEAGCDEAGRGCLAGPVFAAAVILPPDYRHNTLTDSKKLSEKMRYALREVIEKDALGWAVAFVLHGEIDQLNIFKASVVAMHKAIDKLNITPDLLLIDGNKFLKYRSIAYKCIVKGDSQYYSIAAASVLAKTYRDDYMNMIHKEFEHYRWDKNKGYATSIHRKAIEKYGISPYHRKSFRLIDNQLSLDF